MRGRKEAEKLRNQQEQSCGKERKAWSESELFPAMPTLRSQSSAASKKDHCPSSSSPSPPASAPPSAGPSTPAQDHEASRIASVGPNVVAWPVRRSSRLNGDEACHETDGQENFAGTFPDKGKRKAEEETAVVFSQDLKATAFSNSGNTRGVAIGSASGRGRGGGRGRGSGRGRGRGRGRVRSRQAPSQERMSDGMDSEEDSSPRRASTRRKLSHVEEDAAAAAAGEAEARRLRAEEDAAAWAETNRHRAECLTYRFIARALSVSYTSAGDSDRAKDDGDDGDDGEQSGRRMAQSGDEHNDDDDGEEAGPSTPLLDLADAAEAESSRIRARQDRQTRASKKEASRARFLKIAKNRAAHFAHFDPEDNQPSSSHRPEREEQHQPRRPIDSADQEDWPGPFSTARRLVEGRAAAAAARQHTDNSNSKISLVDWQPSRAPGDDASFSKRIRPSLQDFCLNILSAHAENVESLQGVPDLLRIRIGAGFCRRRKMDSKALSLFFQGEPSEIRVPDCSLVNETELTQILAQCSPSRLEVLDLGLCGRGLSDQCLSATLACSPNFLPSLHSLSLGGAYRLTDKGLDSLMRAAPLVTSLELSHCSFLSDVGIKAVADCIGHNLKTMTLDGCNQLDASKLLPALLRMPKLQKLSLAGVGGVSDEVISELVVQLGPTLQELSLVQCSALTDAVVAAIGACCPSLRALNLDHLSLLTDVAVGRIADGCSVLQVLTLTRCKFSDEAFAAFVTASGGVLSELSVNGVRQVADQTLLALAKHAHGSLKKLDASWCRQMSDEGLGYLVDSCSNLRELRLFGCTQVTDKFLKGHINPNLTVVGL